MDEHSLSGTLTKRGSKIKSWKRRYFVLHQNILSYYAHSDSPNKKGEFILDSTTLILNSNLKKYCFCLLNNNSRSLFIAADTEAEKELWVEALSNVVTNVVPYSNCSVISTDDLSIDTSTSKLNQSILFIKVHRAKNLLDKGSSDTYVKVFIGSTCIRTEIIRKNLDPVYNAEFSFKWTSDLRFLRIEVWNADMIAQESFLGCLYVSLLTCLQLSGKREWYKLGKRSTKSHVGGEIEIGINIQTTEVISEYQCYKLFKVIQSLPEIKNVFNDLSFVEDLPVQDLLNQSSRFPYVFPPLELECLEDISTKAILKCPGTGIISNGIVLLTNYRLIFVAKSRLIYGVSEKVDFDVFELTTQISITSITSCSAFVDQDPNIQLELPGIRIRTADVKDFSILFYKTNEDVMIGLKTKKEAHDEQSQSTVQNSKAAKGGGRRNSFEFGSLLKRFNPRRNSISKSFKVSDYDLLTSDESAEGTACQRIFHRLFWQYINRYREVSPMSVIHNTLLAQLAEKAGMEVDTVNMRDERCISVKIPADVLTRQVLLENKTFDINQLDLTQMLNEARPECSTSSRKPFSFQNNSGGSSMSTVEGYQLWLHDLDDQQTLDLYCQVSSGWDVYMPMSEFNRLGIPNSQWRISEININYQLCPTYPSLIAVPAIFSDEAIAVAAGFRSKGRIPALCWLNQKNMSSLTRCSQPLIGFGQNKNIEDENLLKAIVLAGVSNMSADNNRPLIIVDARPKINAQANQAVGKGFELGKQYDHCKLIFMNIPNIHVMRKSLEILEECCLKDDDEESIWSKGLESSGWLGNVQRVLAAAVKIVHLITVENLSVLVHCSDGWDRTPQLTSLSMLLMDPYYRTFKGFQVLIEKEWFSFGHKFCERLGFAEDAWEDAERSPIFFQFLDCVYQCITQLPFEFEFNEELLLFIAKHLYSGWFGNFFVNYEFERELYVHNSVSIWTFVQIHRSRFLNPLFNPKSSPTIVPVASLKRMKLWENWFLGWHSKVWKFAWERSNEELVAVDNSFTPEWMADEMAEKCCECDKKFTFLKRRHHCRACGKIYCENCVNNYRIVATVSDSESVRCCNKCSALIDEALQDRVNDHINQSEIDSSTRPSQSSSSHIQRISSFNEAQRPSNLTWLLARSKSQREKWVDLTVTGRSEEADDFNSEESENAQKRNSPPTKGNKPIKRDISLRRLFTSNTDNV